MRSLPAHWGAIRVAAAHVLRIVVHVAYEHASYFELVLHFAWKVGFVLLLKGGLPV